MEIITISITYLLFGAAIGWYNHEMFEETINGVLETTPMKLKRIVVMGCTIFIIMVSPIVLLIDIILRIVPRR